ncbi:hypothetical protein [Alteromonas macleodii]|uniref:hypothetical protein n=1 Tax=Alteromonas macleodii TaxID=28108 RepID=UPI0008595598|nr:hypothetical protein [Alteromonas macleodii]
MDWLRMAILPTKSIEHEIALLQSQVPFAPVQTRKKRSLSCGFTLRHWTLRQFDFSSCSILLMRKTPCKHNQPTLTQQTMTTSAVAEFAIRSTTAFA